MIRGMGGGERDSGRAGEGERRNEKKTKVKAIQVEENPPNRVNKVAKN